MGHEVSAVTVSATLADARAAFLVRVDDQDGVVALAVGTTVISVVVTAQDGESTLTYAVTVMGKRE